MTRNIENDTQRALLERLGSPLTHFTASTFAEHARGHHTVSMFIARAAASPVAASPPVVAAASTVKTQSPGGIGMAAAASVAREASALLFASDSAGARAGTAVFTVNALVLSKFISLLLAKAALVFIAASIAATGGRQVALLADAYSGSIPSVASAARASVAADADRLGSNVQRIREEVSGAGSFNFARSATVTR